MVRSLSRLRNFIVLISIPVRNCSVMTLMVFTRNGVVSILVLVISLIANFVKKWQSVGRLIRGK